MTSSSYSVGCTFSFDAVELFKTIEDSNRTDFRFNWRTMNDSKNATEPSSDACLLPQTHIIAMIPINLLSIVIGTIGNALVVGAVYTNSSLRIISNYWLASMAIADLMVTAVGQPFLVAFLALQMNGECNEPVSETFRVVGNMSCAASVLHLCFLSVDRCLVIVRPLDFKKIRTMVRFKTALFFAWITPIIYCVLRLTINMKATSYFTVIAGALCYVTIIACYTVIIIKVCTRKTENLRSSRGSRAEEAVERRVTVTIAIVVLVFTISWVPIMYLRSAYAGSNVGIAYNWARTVALSNSALNPWIYCFRAVEFRKTYKKLLGCDRNRANLRSRYWLKKLQSSN